MKRMGLGLCVLMLLSVSAFGGGPLLVRGVELAAVPTVAPVNLGEVPAGDIIVRWPVDKEMTVYGESEFLEKFTLVPNTFQKGAVHGHTSR